MKARITFWVILTAMIVAAGIIVWSHHSSSVKVEAVSQKPVAVPIAQTSVSKIATVVPRPQPTPEQQLTPDIQMIVDSKANYQHRLDAIRSLNGKLADTERETLFDFLRQHNPDDDQQLGQVLKNKLLDALTELQSPPQGLRELLTQIYEDQGQNVVLRDYAVQHLAAFYQQMATAQGVDADTKTDELKQTRQALWEALSETDNSIAGTALLGLTHLSQQGWDGFDQAEIGDKALELAGQNGNELTRITALQVCGSLDVKDSLAIVWGAAQAGETKAVQISAIGALGSLGGKDQIPFLNEVLNGKDERLKVPAQQALNNINRRLKREIQATTRAS